MEEHIKSVGSLALHSEHSLELDQRDLSKRKLNLVDGKVKVIEVNSNKEFEQFIQLPYKIYKDDPIWPGQNEEEVMLFFDPDMSPYSEYMEMNPFIALKDGQVVGRLCVIVNEHYNAYSKENVVFFGFFECVDDQDVANELFNYAVNVALEKGYDTIYGPISPTYQDEVGLLLDSFDKVPVVAMAYNPPYYNDLINKYGFEKVKDLLHPSVDTETFYDILDRKMDKLYPFLEDENIIVRYFDWDNFERDAEIVGDLFFQTFQTHWGYYPAEADEWKKMLLTYRPIVYDEFFLIVEDAGEPIAFTLGFKDTNQDLMAKRLGIAKVERLKWDLIGVKPDYHRNGLGTFIAYNIISGLQKYKMEEVCVSWVLEDNHKSLGLCKSIGMTFHTSYRVFQKKLK